MRNCTVIWTKEDVESVVYDMNRHYQRFDKNLLKLSDNEIAYILQSMEDTHDANVGITWDTIEFWIERVLDNREK